MKLFNVLAIITILLLNSACVVAAESEHPRLLLTAEEVRQNRDHWDQVPQFAAAVAAVKARNDRHFASDPDVPRPKDAGGGYTHEQHKRNAIAIYDAGMLYQWTGEAAYANRAREMLLEYADMYPTLKEHPEKKEQSPGRLFWQSLNEAVWLVYVIQGYDAVFDFLGAEDKTVIERDLLRVMADFLSVESPQTFDRIHNHGTWATAAVGMTGYVIDDEKYVNTALLGLKEDGSAGFLRQLDELFSPDGYYNEGPYYQRYALMPFVVFAQSIDRNDPGRKIFEHRDGILQKAIFSTIQQSYNGLFFPLNDAIKDKGLDTIELDYAIPIAYGLTGDKGLLSLIDENSNLVLTGDGLRVAQARQKGLAEPFTFKSMQFRDGANGNNGALGVLRSGNGPGHTALVFKATSQGMGHGHFDRLNWLYYDNGQEVITDYGAARFLNVVQKNGGHYLPENTTWAKQTVAHNTLVVDGASHFGGKVRAGEKSAPDNDFFEVRDGVQIVSARERNAYAGVAMRRTMLLIDTPELNRPLVLDVLNVESDKPHDYDLPLYYKGQFIDSNVKIEASTKQLTPVGKANGYQHLWNRAKANVDAGERFRFTWLLGNRFYTWHTAADAERNVLMTEVGATDPNFNLRHESGLLVRLSSVRNTTFVNLLEAHGEYNGAREFTTESASQVKTLSRFRDGGKDLVVIETTAGSTVRVALSYNPDPDAAHTINAPAGPVSWTGFYAVLND